MERLLKVAKLDTEFTNIEALGVKVKDLNSIILECKPKIVEIFQKLLPELKLFDCHRLKATIQDLQK